MEKEYRKIASPLLRQALREAADSKGVLSVRNFVQIALYHPSEGYYRKPITRVAKHREADFYTSSSLKSAFAQAIIEASLSLCSENGFNPSETHWIEVGAEPEGGLLNDVDHPFVATQNYGPGDELTITGQNVLFSNELFDAQSFDTFVFTHGEWNEEVLEFDDTHIRPILRPTKRPLSSLPSIAPEGYRIDLPTGSRALAQRLLSSNWEGIFIAFDYGKSWEALTHDLPIGTARGYYRHEQKSDIYSNAGEQDITHHICWDWIQDELAANKFCNIVLESQEAFIIKRASRLLATAFTEKSMTPGSLKSQLRQLIHPSLMGQKFQVVTGIRKQKIID